jgi:exodeoxyribonuclease VII large subunit
MLLKDKNIYTVSQITQEIEVVFGNTFGMGVWVEGEVSDFSVAASGHFYFSLKDDKAILGAAIFSGVNRQIKFKLENGLKVICFGKIGVYGPKGRYQLIVNRIEPKGIGARQLAFEQLKEKLSKEGFFDPAHKRELPLMPFSAGIVTSGVGAAIHDILGILKKGAPGIDIVVRPVRVQGEGAALEIAKGIEELNDFGKVDLIIVSRGGGSTEDLWAFNEEPCARAVYNSKIPVISAVGHQINISLCDLVADFFVETPTAAAKIIVDKKNSLLTEISELRHEMEFSISDKINYFENEVTRLKTSLKSPLDRLQEKEQFLDELYASLHNNARQIIGITKERLKSFIDRLDALSPLKVLSRGYSLSINEADGAVIKSVFNINPGDKIKTILSKGAFISRVEEIIKESKDERKTVL